MKKIIVLLCFGLTMEYMYGQVGIGTVNPSSASMLEISSTSDGGNTYRGFMPPRVLTSSERDAINPTPIDVGLMIFVESIGCLQLWNGTSWENMYCLDTIAVEPWINELHYDNIGLDEGEFVEIVGPSGMDLGNYRLLFYNGDDGTVYYGLTLFGIIDNEQNNYGAISFFPLSIQNDMEGVALIKRSNGQVLQFISYEGSFEATENLANGLTSTDIGVEESDIITPIGHSLQLTGTGSTYNDFNWNAPADDSPGDLNVGQIID